jgi:HEAT repeat protein
MTSTINQIKNKKKEEKKYLDSIKRLEAYRAIGFTKEALSDEHWEIRLEAYRAIGFTKEALSDEYWYVRLEAYEALGFTKEALNDKNLFIVGEATEFFNKCRAILEVKDIKYKFNKEETNLLRINGLIINEDIII